MEFLTREELNGEVTVIKCPRRLDASVADVLRSLLKNLVDQGKFKIVIDLKDTEFVDSSGLGALVSRIAVTRANKGDVRLVSVCPNIQKVLQITHLDQIFKCFDDVDSAVKSFE